MSNLNICFYGNYLHRSSRAGHAHIHINQRSGRSLKHCSRTWVFDYYVKICSNAFSIYSSCENFYISIVVIDVCSVYLNIATCWRCRSWQTQESSWRAYAEGYRISTLRSLTNCISNVIRLCLNSNLQGGWSLGCCRKSQCLDLASNCDCKVLYNRHHSRIACQCNCESHIISANIIHRGCWKAHRWSWDSQKAMRWRQCVSPSAAVRWIRMGRCNRIQKGDILRNSS